MRKRFVGVTFLSNVRRYGIYYIYGVVVFRSEYGYFFFMVIRWIGEYISIGVGRRVNMVVVICGKLFFDCFYVFSKNKK